jgi:hypothetical protein
VVTIRITSDKLLNDKKYNRFSCTGVNFMKMRIGAVAIVMATVFASSAALAQTATTPEAQAEPNAMTAPEPMAQPEAAAPAPGEAAPIAEAGLQKRDGKWWNGDKPASKAEIAAQKKAEKTRPHA